MPTRLECTCNQEIPEVKAFHLKGKARLSWNTDALKFTAFCLQVFFKVGFHKNFAIFTGKHLC